MMFEQKMAAGAEGLGAGAGLAARAGNREQSCTAGPGMCVRGCTFECQGDKKKRNGRGEEQLKVPTQWQLDRS